MSNTYGTWTLFKRETMRFSKVYLQTVLAPVLNNLLYFAIFGISLHRAIPNIQGVNYLEFLVPGLIIMGIINNAYQNPSSSLIIMKYQQLISDLLIIPLKTIEILIAFIGSALLRGLIVGGMTYLTAIFFVDFHYTSIISIIGGSILVSLFFGFFGFLIGLWANEFDRQAFIQNFILMPLIFLGGVFYPISSLPENLQTISTFNPIFHMINLLRYGFTGVTEFPITTSLIILISGCIFLFTLNYFLLQKGWRLKN